MIKIGQSYQTRSIRFLELWELLDWRIKVYGIAYQGEYPSKELVVAAKQVAKEQLLQVDADQTYGVGFLGIHEGKTANFVFVDWWADENELHHHVYISPLDNPGDFTYSTPTGLIACVWDLRLLGFEREAWFETVLKNHSNPNLQNYLSLQLNEDI